MSDEIRKVIASALQDARHEGQRVRFSDEYAGAMTEAALNALHAAGYEIVPGWSDEMDAAPRDGTPVDLWVNDERIPNCIWSGGSALNLPHWRRANSQSPSNITTRVEGIPTHWKPISPLKESE